MSTTLSQDPGAPIDLSSFDDNEILGALLNLSSLEQGEILAGWVHKLEQTGMHHTLQHQISRRCGGVGVPVACTSTQTDLHGSHLGDKTTDELAKVVAQLEDCLDVMVKALTKTGEDVYATRTVARETHSAIMQTKNTSELCANLMRNVMGHQNRIERRMSATTSLGNIPIITTASLGSDMDPDNEKCPGETSSDSDDYNSRAGSKVSRRPSKDTGEDE